MDPRQELAVKHDRVRSYLDQHNLQAVLLSGRHNFAWTTGGGQNYVNQAGELGVASLLVTRDDICCFCPNIEADRFANEEVGPLGIEVVAYPWWQPAELGSLLAERVDPAGVATDAALPHLPAGVRALPGDFGRIRWQLTEPEMQRYRRLGEEVGKQLEAVARTCRPGITEHELAGELAGNLNRLGVRTPVVLVANDDRITSYRHPIPTDKRLERCAMLVICGERWGLICSATRLVHLGPPPQELASKHQAVCRVDARMMAATRAGSTLGEVFAEAQAAYADTGWPDEWQLHHQGGPTGYLSREAKATPSSTAEVLENQAFAWNPSITGTKSEDTLLVTAGGSQIITATGDWPTVRMELDDGTYPRADILVL